MPNHPLLVFPTPEMATRTTRSFPPRPPHRPSTQRQGERISPQFNQLQSVFEQRHVEAATDATGLDPEEVLVIETVGSVENFIRAVSRIHGFEWMSEIEIDDIEPDDDFFDEENPDKKLNGRLYLVLSNQQALREMVSLWEQYQRNPSMQFAHGLTKFRDIFNMLKNIRKWDVQDRLLETGVIEAWEEDLQYDEDRPIRFELELWYRTNHERRNVITEDMTNLIQSMNGQVISQIALTEIAYHGLLVELSAQTIHEIIDNPNVELVANENIMFFRPVGQMVVGKDGIEGDISTEEIEDRPLPQGDPIIALFDGLPLSQHQYLKDRLIIDDPENWEDTYPASDRVHGTSMASLIIQGDLNDGQNPLNKPIYIRPIMKPIDWHSSPKPEAIPQDILVVDLIHLAVKRLFEGEGGESPVAPHIRIINLSIGDPSRQFLNALSPLARLIDWLSIKYNVLFIVSSGNHATPIEISMPKSDFQALSDAEKEKLITKALYNDMRHRKLLSPSEGINGITVGAIHHDNSTIVHMGDQIDPFDNILPSPVSAFGSGYRRSIKPDLVFYGGKQFYKLPLLSTGDTTSLEAAIFRLPPGQKVATPGGAPGELNVTSFSSGTSNATALISRNASIIYEQLKQIIEDQTDIESSEEFEIPLLKSLLIHGSSWGDTGERLKDILSPSYNANKVKKLISQWMGYGLPDIDKVLHCTEQRATLIGFGKLNDGEAHLFRLPLPPSLSAQAIQKKLTVTLAWQSPVVPSTQKYRSASLWFEVNHNSLADNRQNADHHAVRRGTIQHEIFMGNRAEPIVDGDFIEIKVNCKKDAANLVDPVAYGLALTLEVAEGVDIAIYNEIQTRIRPTVEIQQVANR